jgi:hypothetical protein
MVSEWEQDPPTTNLQLGDAPMCSPVSVLAWGYLYRKIKGASHICQKMQWERLAP